jgi:hypothetical protein
MKPKHKNNLPTKNRYAGPIRKIVAYGLAMVLVSSNSVIANVFGATRPQIVLNIPEISESTLQITLPDESPSKTIGLKPKQEPSVQNEETQKSNLILTDASTNIKMTYSVGVVPEGAKLVVQTQVSSKAAIDAIESVTSEYALYEITLLSGVGEINPTNKVKMSIPVSDHFTADNSGVYYIDKSGDITDVKADLKNGYLEFETKKQGVFAVAFLPPGFDETPETDLSASDSVSKKAAPPEEEIVSLPPIDETPYVSQKSLILGLEDLSQPEVQTEVDSSFDDDENFDDESEPSDEEDNPVKVKSATAPQKLSEPEVKETSDEETSDKTKAEESSSDNEEEEGYTIAKIAPDYYKHPNPKTADISKGVICILSMIASLVSIILISISKRKFER